MGGTEDVVIIPVELKMEKSDEVESYINRFKGQFENMKRILNQDTKNDILQRTKENSLKVVESLTTQIQQLKELSTATEEASNKYQNLQNIVMQMGKGMKSGKGAYADTTKEEFEAQKALAAEANKSFREQRAAAQEAAASIVPNIEQTTKSLWEEVTAFGALRKAEDAEGNIRTQVAQSHIGAENSIRAAQMMEEATGDTLLQQAKELVEMEGKRATMSNVMAKYRELEAQATNSETGAQKDNTAAIEKQNEELTKLINKEYQYTSAKSLQRQVNADNATLESRLQQLAIMSAEAEKQLLAIKQEELRTGENTNTEKQEELELTKKIIDLETKSIKAQITKNNAVLKGLASGRNSAENIQKQTTNFYYLLRATKMLSEQFNRVSKNANNMFRGMLTVGGKVLKMFGRLSLGALNLASAFKRTHKASNNFNGSLKMGIRNLLKYTLGIRSFYVLFNKLRHAMSEGMQALALQFPYVNKQMSSLLSSVVTMRNAIATAVQPLLRLLVPALKAVSNAAIEASYNIASFFATLTGQTFVYKAIRANEDYAASFDKASKSAKKAKQQLSGLEKLNVINSNKDSGAGSSGAAQVAEIATVADVMAKKVKKIFKDIFKPIKKAWSKEGKFVMDAWHFMLDECWTLIKHIGRDFMTMWKNDRGVKIWENILHIVGDVFEVVGWIAKRFREAWDEAEKGLAIFEGLQLLVDIIIQGIRDAMDATVEWAKQLDFNPLLSATIRWIYSLVKPTQTIVDILVDFWKNVILPFRKFLIEKGLPDLLDTLMRINHAVDWDGLKEKILAFNKALEPFLEKFWQALLIILEDIGDALANFVNSDAFDKFVDKIIEWMNNASPEDMAKGIEDLVKGLALLVVVFKGLSIAGEAAVQIGTITNAFMQLRNFIAKGGLVGASQTILSLSDTISGLPNIVWGAFTKVDGAIATFTSKAAERLLLFIMDPLAMFKYSLTSIPKAISTGLSTAAVNVETAIAGLETSVATGMANIETALAGFNPLTGVLLIVGGLIAAFTSFFDMTANGFSALKEAIMLVGIALVTVGAIILGAPAAIAIAIASAVALLLTAIVLYRDGFFEKMAEFKQRVLDGIHNLGKTIGRILGTIASKIINGVKDFSKNVINNIKKTFEGKSFLQILKEIGIFILKGVLWILFAPAKLAKFILEAVWNFFTGLVEGFNETFDIHSPAKAMEPIGINIIKGVFAGILSVVSGIGEWVKSKIFDPFKKGLKDAFGIASGKAKELLADGHSIMEGVKSGAEEKWESVKTWFSGKWDTLKSDATVAVDKFKEIGRDMIDGLKEGAGKAMETSKSWWDNLWGGPAKEAEDVNEINSPSKVFKKIGNYMTEGLYEGVEENADDVTHAFDDIVPSTKSLDDLYTRFMKMFTNLRTDAVDSVGSMVDEIGSLLEKLDKIDATTAVMEQFKSIDIPKIAKGFTLPTNVSMALAKQNDEKQQVDLSKLPDMLRDAFVEAILETDKDKKYNDDIVIEMNGKEIFRAMRRENEVWKKRHRGQTAFG